MVDLPQMISIQIHHYLNDWSGDDDVREHDVRGYVHHVYGCERESRDVCHLRVYEQLDVRHASVCEHELHEYDVRAYD